MYIYIPFFPEDRFCHQSDVSFSFCFIKKAYIIYIWQSKHTHNRDVRLRNFLYQMIYTIHNPENISKMFQCCFMFDVTSWRCTTPNQFWNNVAYVNVEICNVEQCPIEVGYFNVDLNNVRQVKYIHCNVANISLWEIIK